MQTNQVRNLFLANAPANVQAQAQAGDDAVRQATAPTGPYLGRGINLARALEAGLGGFLEGNATKQAMQGDQENRQRMAAIANALYPQGPGAPAAQGGAMSAPMPSAMPLGQGGVGSDRASMARNPGGYDPKAVEALIRSRAPAFGIDPDAAVNVARHEGLHVYNGDGGSSFGPFQLHYGGVAKGGNSVGGLGDTFTKQTGLDARDPSTVPQQIDFALSQAAKGGWGPWHGAQAARMGNWDGIGRGGSDPGINVAAVGPTTAAPGINAALPAGARNTDPGISVSGSSAGTLAGGQGSDAIGAPASDGTVRGDLLAAVAQHGGLDPDAPAPDAQATGMAGLPPGVTPAMWAASQNTATDGNALRRGDEMPAGTPPYVPGQSPAPPAPPISPATSNATAAAALSTLKPDLGVTQPAAVPDPVSASTPDAPAPPSILPPAHPPSGDVAGPASVPAPQGDLAPPTPASDGSARGDLLAAWAQHDPVGLAQMQGRDVASDPVVPDPVGSLAPAAPSSPNDALQGPQSDAAAGGAALEGAGIAAAPQASLPDTAPMPPPGAQTLQAPADAASAAAAAAGPELDPEGTGTQNYPQDGGPTLRDTLEAAFKGSPAPATPGQVDVDQANAPAPVAALGATPDAPAGTPPMVGGSSPASAPLPTFAQAGTPGPSPMPPQPGIGAALPATGPMPPSGGQTPGAGSSLPQTGPMPPPGAQSLALANALDGSKPAPGAVPAGPAPVQNSPLADALSPPMQPGGSGTNAPAGNSPIVDPSSAQNGMMAGMARPGAGTGLMSGPPPVGAMPTSGGTGLMGPVPASGQQPSPTPSGGAGLAPAPLGGGAPAAPAPATGVAAPGGAPGQPAGAAPAGVAPDVGQARAAAQAIMQSRFATPQQQEFAMKILMPPIQTVTGADGRVYGIDPMTRQMRLLGDIGAKFKDDEGFFQNGQWNMAPGKPVALGADQRLVMPGPNNSVRGVIAAAPTPDFKPVDGTAAAMDSHSGNVVGLPAGAGGFNTSLKLPGGTEVPIRVTPGANGGQPRVEYLTPGGQPGQGATGGSPLGGVQPLVDQAQAMQAQGAAQTKEAEGQVASLDKMAQAGVDARAKVADLNDLKTLSGNFGAGSGPMVAKWLGDHGYVTKGSSDVEAYQGLAGYIATQMRQQGSGALRNQEMDRFQADLGNLQMTPAARLDAINRAQRMFGRIGDMGDIAANSRATPQARVDQIHALASQPYGAPAQGQGGAGQPGAGQSGAQPPQPAAPAAGPPPAAAAYLKANPGLAAQFDAKYGAGASASVLGR